MANNTLLSFHGKPELKEQLENRMELHTIQDEIVQGAYWENGKGCWIGCATHSSDPQILEDQFGIPVIVTRLGESIFEGLPANEAKTFPLEIVRSIPVGVDLSYVWPEFAIWLLTDPEHGVVRFNDSPSIRTVADLYRQYGCNIPAADAARAARAAAAYADAAAAAAARAAAARAADAAAYAAARADARRVQRSQFIKLLSRHTEKSSLSDRKLAQVAVKLSV